MACFRAIRCVGLGRTRAYSTIRRPAMFGWVDCNDNRVRSMSVKQPLGSPPTDPVFTGTVTFRSETYSDQVLSDC